MRRAISCLLGATVLLLAPPRCLAQQPGHNPFAGSGCNCSAFCAGSCSINATRAANRTLYRMTPLAVDGLKNKNTGDAPGDTSYVISRRTAAIDCKKDPSSFQCAALVVKGDDPNSTDLVIRFGVEVDGNWGPYLYCNPTDAKHPEAPWNCTTTLGTTAPPDYPAQCDASYGAYNNYCLGGRPFKVKTAATLLDCCAAANATHASAYTYHASNASCELHLLPSFHAFPCTGVVGIKHSGPSTPPCECARVHQTVGRENLTAASGSSSQARAYHPAGGEWLSHPGAAECRPGAVLGTAGCAWRRVGAPVAVNATCVYDRIDANVEGFNKKCFDGCPTLPGGGYNRTGDCYSECYSKAVTGTMTAAQLTAPWENAFTGSDPCPSVDMPSPPLSSL